MSIDPIIAVRGVHFVATVLAVGPAAFMALVAEPDAGLRKHLSRLTWSALVLAVVSGAAWLALLAADLTGDKFTDAIRNGGVWTVLTETRFGIVSTLRLTLAVALALLILWPRARWLALAAAAAFIALLGWIGHAGAQAGPSGDLPLASDVVHLLTAGVWVGGLPALAMLLAQSRKPARPAFAAAAVSRFGWLGVICVATLVASGFFNAWNLLASPRDFITTDYGRLLLFKFGLVAVMLMFAAVNRFRLTPRLPAPGAQAALGRNSLVEAALGLGVLLLVGALGALPPPAHRHDASAEVPSDAAFVHIHDIGVMADVTITPGRASSATATIRVSREDGDEFAAKEVRLALDPPTGTAQPIDQPAIRQPDGSWKVPRLDIGQPGIWTVRVILMTDGGQPRVLDAPIVIER